jgi:hypothetical protein
MVERFQLIILKDNNHKVFIFHKMIGHNQQMIHITFEVIRSKVKMTGVLSASMVSAYYLETTSVIEGLESMTSNPVTSLALVRSPGNALVV